MPGLRAAAPHYGQQAWTQRAFAGSAGKAQAAREMQAWCDAVESEADMPGSDCAERVFYFDQMTQDHERALKAARAAVEPRLALRPKLAQAKEAAESGAAAAAAAAAAASSDAPGFEALIRRHLRDGDTARALLQTALSSGARPAAARLAPAMRALIAHRAGLEAHSAAAAAAVAAGAAPPSVRQGRLHRVFSAGDDVQGAGGAGAAAAAATAATTSVEQNSTATPAQLLAHPGLDIVLNDVPCAGKRRDRRLA